MATGRRRDPVPGGRALVHRRPDGIRSLDVGKIDSRSELAATRSVHAIVQTLLDVGRRTGAVRKPERRRLSPLDACPDSPAMRAIADLADRLLDAEGGGTTLKR